MDGEARPADVMAVLEHLPGCVSCQQFTRDVRELQGVVDRLPVAPGSTASLEAQAQELGPALLSRDLSDNVETSESPAGTSTRKPGRVVAMERAPRWVWALAASLLVALGFGLGDRMNGTTALGPFDADGEVVVELGADAGRMTDERFVGLAVELLRADSRYRDKMSELLDEVAQSRAREGFEGEVAHWRDEGARPSGEEGGGVMGEMLRVSPMKEVY
jgi:hypothetical protein